MPAVVDGNGIHPEFCGDLSEGFTAQIRLQHSIQNILVEAYVSGSKNLLLQALMLDPVAISPAKAEAMVDHMLNIQAEYLPDLK